LHNVKILTIDDDAGILRTLNEYLQREGYKVVEAASLKSAYSVIERETPDVVIIDFHLPDGDALQFLSAVRNMAVPMCCIVLTGHGTIDLAVRAIKEGAEQFITKPVELAALGACVRACVERQQNRRKQLAGARDTKRHEKDPFLGSSSVIERLSQESHKILQAERPVLIQGETGTGKGVLAKWIHRNGPRAEEALVDVNCAGLSKELLESELFGHEKGAFTGATASKPGLVEVAHRGILFLDEVGEMDLTVQPKLLKVLEDKRFRRLGDVRERSTDIQIIAATNRDLLEAAGDGRFREDLYYRISTFRLRIPPLRDRVEDIITLANAILHTLAGDLAREQHVLSKAAEKALQGYIWPGNIRELRNVLERVALICENRVIEPQDLHLPYGVPFVVANRNLTLNELERQRIVEVLGEEQGRVAQAAVRLGIPRSTLYQKIKVLGINLESYAHGATICHDSKAKTGS